MLQPVAGGEPGEAAGRRQPGQQRQQPVHGARHHVPRVQVRGGPRHHRGGEEDSDTDHPQGQEEGEEAAHDDHQQPPRRAGGAQQTRRQDGPQVAG